MTLLILLICSAIFGSTAQFSLNYWSGLTLLAGFGAIIYQLTRSTHEENKAINTPFKGVYLFQILGGLGLLLVGGKLIIDASNQITIFFGISDAFIGLFLIAMGTSLPELITTVIAALKGNTNLAIGNILGSNIFNILLVLGICSTLSPITLNPILKIDLAVMILSSILLAIAFLVPKQYQLNRWKGTLFTLTYILYLVFISIRG